MILPGVNNIFAPRTKNLRPKHMFPSLATPGNITRKIVFATMFPILARPLGLTGFVTTGLRILGPKQSMTIIGLT